MKEKLQSFYLKKGTFLFFAVAAMLTWLIWSITTVIAANPVKLTVFGFLFFALTGGMTLAYLKGETNVQKMLFGSLLIFFIIDYIEIIDVYITYHMISSAVIIGISLAIFIIFYVCHALQQQDHIGKSLIVIINQCCGIIIILSVAFLLFAYIGGSIGLTDYAFCIAVMFSMSLVICMETRISVYKQLRAAYKAKGEWNEANRAEAKKLFKLS